jgi:protein ImuB
VDCELAAEISRIIGILHQWGIHSLGELAALERDQLGARLGPHALRLWDQASGNSHRLLRLVRPPETFEETIEFEYEIETAEPLLFVLRRFLDQLTRRLAAQYLVARALFFRLTFADKTDYQHQFEIPHPTRSVEILFRLLQTHLENFRAEQPIVAVALSVQPTRPARQQFDLFETPLRDPGRLHETLTRLTGLLGADRVGTPVLEDSHRPDSFHLEPFVWKLPESPNELAPKTGPALRRLRQGKSITVLRSKIVARAGPYRSSGNWWDEKSWVHTEWDAQLEGCSIYRIAKQPNEWRVEGIYD